MSVGLVVTGYLDYRTGPTLSLGGVYLFLVAVGAVVGGRRVGLLLSVAAVAADVLADAVIGLPPRHPTESAANAALLLAVLFAVAFTADRLRSWSAAAARAERRSAAFLVGAYRQVEPHVTALRAAAERVGSGRGTDVVDDLVDVVRIAERSGRLVDRLLLAARMEQDPVVTLAPTDLVELCERELANHRIERPDCSWALEASAADVGVAELDARVTQAILADLLDEAGRRARTRVTVLVSVVGGELSVLVLDDGDRDGGDDNGRRPPPAPPSASVLARAIGGRLDDHTAGPQLRVPYREVAR